MGVEWVYTYIYICIHMNWNWLINGYIDINRYIDIMRTIIPIAHMSHSKYLSLDE